MALTLITNPTLNRDKLGYICSLGCSYIYQRIEETDLDLNLDKLNYICSLGVTYQYQKIQEV